MLHGAWQRLFRQPNNTLRNCDKWPSPAPSTSAVHPTAGLEQLLLCPLWTTGQLRNTYNVLHCTVLCCVVLNRVPHCTVLHCVILHPTVQYCTVGCNVHHRDGGNPWTLRGKSHRHGARGLITVCSLIRLLPALCSANCKVCNVSTLWNIMLLISSGWTSLYFLG